MDYVNVLKCVNKFHPKFFKAMHPTKNPMAGSAQLCIEKLCIPSRRSSQGEKNSNPCQIILLLGK